MKIQIKKSKFVKALLVFSIFGVLLILIYIMQIPEFGILAGAKRNTLPLPTPSPTITVEQQIEDVLSKVTEAPAESKEVKGTNTYQVSPTTKWIDCGSGHLVTDLSQCGQNKANNPTTKPQQQNQAPQFQPRNYTPCTINYPSGPITYDYTTDEDCKSLQERVANSKTLWPDPTPNVSEPSQSNSNTSELCRNSVTSRYEGLFQSCSAYGSGTREACIQNYTNLRNSEYSSCG